ncbi:hypothetical protein [Halocola ammonii]
MAVLLLGAGAVIDWGAPSTSQITDEIIADSTFRSYQDQPLGEWINHKLAGLYSRDPESINFETIANSIEYLSTFFSSKYRPAFSEFKNLMPAFFTERDDLMEILWFDRIYQTKNNEWVVDGREQGQIFWNDYDAFFASVYRYYINKVVSLVEKYSKRLEEHHGLNGQLDWFLKSLKEPIRCYTTNYDRFIPLISKLPIFEGFTENSKNELVFDPTTVLNNSQVNCWYNLHGSVHFKKSGFNSVKYEKEKFIRNFGIGSGSVEDNDQDSRRLLQSNLITGFNKSSRILLDPYSQFYHRFYADCLEAKKIYVIGYSFTDFHLNRALRTALTINEDVTIEIISYHEYSQLFKEWQSLDQLEGNMHNIQLLNSLFGRVATSDTADRINIWLQGFKKFLEKYTN